MLFAWITDPNAWLALGTLTLLEIVLGIDNIIFLSLVVAKLPTAQRAHARRLGLAGAMVMRLALLASIAWVTRLTNPLFTIFSQEISARDLILLLGGLFLIWKASKEIHESIEGEEEGLKTRVSSFLGAIVQIMLLDIIFQPRLGDYRCGSVRSPVYYDGCRGDCRRRDDVRRALDW
ncbi:integral membrane transport protein [Escherichia coli]|uniref:Integral membrane transport protein n=1 Tax=Escherichia coli TaxID=562 RepID=A0A377K3D7_ECOLX|nr:integral membrane transport protein [Escherichia coli]